MTTAATVGHNGSAVKSDTHAHRYKYVGQAMVARSGSACSAPVMLGCASCPGRVVVDCNATSAGKCEACAASYRDRVRLVAKVPTGSVLLLTLTAPGRRSHFFRGERCVCTPAGGVDLAEWNSTSGAAWNRFWNNGVLRDSELSVLWAAYFRATEVQDRGALHFHVLIRCAAGTVVAPGVVERLRRLAVTHGFGHEIDLQAVDLISAMHYVAKYVTKASGARKLVPWRSPQRPQDFTTDRDTGEVFLYRRQRATFRTWSASRADGRCWPTSMRDVKAAQQHWLLTMRALPAWEPLGLSPGPVWALLGVERPAPPGAG